MNVTQLLKDSRAFIANRDNWCQGKTVDGEKRCAIAAVHRVAQLTSAKGDPAVVDFKTIMATDMALRTASAKARDLLDDAMKALYGPKEFLFDLNDAFGTFRDMSADECHAAVLRVYDKAIEMESEVIK